MIGEDQLLVEIGLINKFETYYWLGYSSRISLRMQYTGNDIKYSGGSQYLGEVGVMKVGCLDWTGEGTRILCSFYYINNAHDHHWWSVGGVGLMEKHIGNTTGRGVSKRSNILCRNIGEISWDGLKYGESE